jgi:2-iminobutanoate/2-iminopropanoate deaminase
MHNFKKIIAITLATSMLLCGAVSVQAQTKQAIATTGAPTAIGPYSQAIKFGDTLYLSGQIAIDPKTNTMLPATSTIEEQTTLVMENLKAVLAANGMTMADVVSTTVLMKDLNEFGKMNALYATYFKDAPPARATFEAARIPRDAKIEIAAIARK